MSKKEIAFNKAIASVKSCKTFEQLRCSLQYSILYHKQFKDYKGYVALSRLDIAQRRLIEAQQSIGSNI